MSVKYFQIKIHRYTEIVVIIPGIYDKFVQLH